MKIVVVDGQGGKIGKNLIEMIKKLPLNSQIYAIGTNSIATSVMVKAGADYAATGENPIIVNSQNADVIIGPIGIAITDSLLGEITNEMAAAIGRSKALKILLPVNKCSIAVAGLKEITVSALIEDAVRLIASYHKNNS